MFSAWHAQCIRPIQAFRLLAARCWYHEPPRSLLKSESSTLTSTTNASSKAVTQTLLRNVASSFGEEQPASSGSSSPTTPSIKVTCLKPDRMLSYSTLDKCGKFINRSMFASKTDLCAWHHLLLRDLRKLDSSLKNQLPAILPRSKCILVNLYFIKAIIKCDRVILFENASDSPERQQQLAFLTDLQQHLQRSSDVHHVPKAVPIDADVRMADDMLSLPFELRVLELMLQKICTTLQDQLDILAPRIDVSLYHLERFIHWEKLEILLACKKSMNEYQRLLVGLKNCVEELVDNDIDMAEMNLTRSRDLQRQLRRDRTLESVESLDGPESTQLDHEDVEMLLESYLLMVEEMHARASFLLQNIASTEDIVNIGLISQRNNLLLLDLKVSIAMFSITTAGLGASLFGMNLATGLEHHPWAFLLTSGTLASLGGLAFWLVWRKMRSLIRKS